MYFSDCIFQKAYVHYYGILDYVTSDLLFFSLARIAFNTGNKKSINTIVTAVIFVVTNCLYSYFYVTQMPSGVLKGVLYLIRSISSVTGIMTVCNISKHLQNKAPQRLLKTLGMYSYDIYLMHAPFLVSGLMGILLAYSPFPTVICCVSVLVLGLFIPIIVSKIHNTENTVSVGFDTRQKLQKQHTYKRKQQFIA